MDQGEDEVGEIRAHVLPHYGGWDGAAVTRIGTGLINRSYLLARTDGTRAVLQAVSPIFPPEMHGNIVAVTERLAAAGLVTPRLLTTGDGRPYLIAPGGGLWRLLTHVDGVSFDVVAGADAGARRGRAGRPVPPGRRRPETRIRRHACRRPRHTPPPGAPRRSGRDPRRAPAVRRGPAARGGDPAGAAALPPLPALTPRICHGDLKFNNILFAGRTPPDDTRAIALIDLDTVGPLSLAYELGDAWRSWCNRAGEDDVNAVLDLEIMGASLRGYAAGLGRDLSADERRALLLGVEWVSLELAARFAADALFESYFGWDAARYPGRGEHNLLRARGQWSLHGELLATREKRAAML